MPKTKVSASRRKKRVYMCRKSPFPVPIASISGETAGRNHWFYYTGRLQGCSVIVQDSGDMDFLYKMGFFGKGEMSRGQAEWCERFRTVRLPVSTCMQKLGWGHVLQAKVISRRRYMTHLKWQLLFEENLDELELLQSEENSLECTIAACDEVEQNLSKNGHNSTQNVEVSQGDSSMISEEMKENFSNKLTLVKEYNFWLGRSELNMSPEMNPNQPFSNKNITPRNWDDEEGDTDFWGSSSVNQICSDEPMTSLEESSETRAVSAMQIKKVESDSPVKKSFELFQNGSGLCTSSRTDISVLETKQTLASKATSSENVQTENFAPNAIEESVSDDPSQSGIVLLRSDNQLNASHETVKSKESDEILLHPVGRKSPNQEPDSSEIKRLSSSNNKITGAAFSKYCEEDDKIPCSSDTSDAWFVIPDSDEEEVGNDDKIFRMKKGWKAVLKKDPFPLRERLSLTLEEAFFLSFGLGCLTVLSSDEISLDLVTMWREFCQRSSAFLPNYIAYHYFRSKNWVPKPGLKFGCDFLLYKEGPPFYHGSYSVVVRFLNSDGQPVQNHSVPRHFSWTSLAGLKRITEHVGKELLLCYVIKPTDLSEEDLASPACISRFQIKEVLVSRWVSSQERENKGLDDIP